MGRFVLLILATSLLYFGCASGATALPESKLHVHDADRVEIDYMSRIILDDQSIDKIVRKCIGELGATPPDPVLIINTDSNSKGVVYNTLLVSSEHVERLGPKAVSQLCGYGYTGRGTLVLMNGAKCSENVDLDNQVDILSVCHSCGSNFVQREFYAPFEPRVLGLDEDFNTVRTIMFDIFE